MENQQTQQSGTSTGLSKNGNGRKRLSMAGLVVGAIAVAFVIICLLKIFTASSSRPSTPAEIAAQKEFQIKLSSAQEVYQQRVDAATKEAGEREMELHEKSYSAQEEFLRKLDAAAKEEKQKSDSSEK